MELYNQADQHFHLLAQLLAQTNKAFQREQKDDSHSNIHFDADSRYLVGRRMIIPDSGLQFYPAIDLEKTTFITLRLMGEKEVAFKIDGLTMDEAKKKLAAFWREKGLDTLSFEQSMHYQIPDYDFASKKVSPLKKAAIDEWAEIRSKANDLLSIQSGEKTLHSLVRIWPHHFDTGFYDECDDYKGIGVGFAMKDGISDLPYFYVTAFEKNKFMDIERPPEIEKGHWELEGDWKGALFQIENSTFDVEEIQLWMKKTYNYFIEKLELKLSTKTLI